MRNPLNYCINQAADFYEYIGLNAENMVHFLHISLYTFPEINDHHAHISY